MATLACPYLFEAVEIGPEGDQRMYIDASKGHNNPITEVIKEACEKFGDKTRVAKVVSIGSGLPPILSLNSGDPTLQALSKLVKDISEDCETTARDAESRFGRTGAYSRFSVDRGLDKVDVDEWAESSTVTTHTDVYLQGPTVTRQVDMCLKAIIGRVGHMTLEQLGILFDPCFSFH